MSLWFSADKNPCDREQASSWMVGYLELSRSVIRYTVFIRPFALNHLIPNPILSRGEHHRRSELCCRHSAVADDFQDVCITKCEAQQPVPRSIQRQHPK